MFVLAFVKLPEGSQYRWQFEGRVPMIGEIVYEPDTGRRLAVKLVEWERNRAYEHVPTLTLVLSEDGS